MSGLSALAAWWSFTEAQREMGGEEPFADDQVILYFMGSGASTAVTAKDIREVLAMPGPDAYEGAREDLLAWKRRAQAAEAEVTRLRRDASEAYQVIGAGMFGTVANFSQADVERALDNLDAAANGTPRPHDDLLPWPKPGLSDDDVKLLFRVEMGSSGVRCDGAVSSARELAASVANTMAIGALEIAKASLLAQRWGVRLGGFYSAEPEPLVLPIGEQEPATQVGATD